MTRLTHRVHGPGLGIFGLGWGMTLGLTVLSASPAFARGESLEHQATQARKACLSGDYPKGVSILSDLFVKTEDPNYIYNQGRCFEQNGRWEEAIPRFEEYLRLTKDSHATADRATAEGHIADCQAKLGKTATVAPPAPATAEPTPTTPVTQQQPVVLPQPIPAPTPAAAPVTLRSSTATSTDGSGLRVAGIAVASVGAASLLTAVALNLKANSMADDLNQPTGYSRSKVSQRSTYETMSWVGYGVGSACLVGGAIVYYVGYLRNHDASQVALLPSFSPDHVGLSLHGAFE